METVDTALASLQHAWSTLALQAQQHNPMLLAIALAYGAIVIAGIARGYNGSITVYRNFADLFVVAGVLVLPVATFWLGLYLNAGPFGLYAAAAIALGMLVTVMVRTGRDNAGLLNTLHALLTKLPLCFLFVLALVEAFMGKNRRQRGGGALVALLLAPILVALVRDRRDAALAGGALRPYGAA